MNKCPFCHLNLKDTDNFCPLCGYPQVLSLPYKPVIKSKGTYILLAILSIFLGTFSFIFSYASLNLLGLLFVVFSLVFAGICLEGIAHKLNGTIIKYLAITGLVLGIFGYLFSIFFNSHVPTSGYSM